MNEVIRFILHLDTNLAQYIAEYGNLTYGLLFGIIFCETGLVAAPFLPGDSLLFLAGAFAGAGALNIGYLLITFMLAAVMGNTSNYIIGRVIGPQVFHYENSRIFNQKNLERTHVFFEVYGGKTLIITRFVPILRTFAPFVAGVSAMNHAKFQVFNIAGATLWVSVLTFIGYYFGNLPVVRSHLTLAIIIIVCLSFLPGLIEYFRTRRKIKIDQNKT
ncbi:MAG TPA: DedA family protein [Burkholderiales bacterium]|nr:DedA family protein [Burkholderiales bacterium]